MKISVVTLSFNQRLFLEQALRSVIDQGYENLEYIVVDPGSTDGSRELIKEYRSELAAIIFEPDKGAADGLNKGFAKATGQIFAFLNADDLLLRGSLNTVAEHFRDHPICDILMGDGFIIDAEGRRQKHVRARGFTVRRYLHGGCRWLQQATFFRQSIFSRSSGFNVVNRTCWDGELFVKMVNDGAVVEYLQKDLAEFRIHANSISGSNSNFVQYRDDSYRIYREICGRDWGAIASGQHALYRAEGLFLRIAAGR